MDNGLSPEEVLAELDSICKAIQNTLILHNKAYSRAHWNQQAGLILQDTMIDLCLVLADDNNLGTTRRANPVEMRCLRAKPALTNRASSGSTASSTANSTVFERTGGVDGDDAAIKDPERRPLQQNDPGKVAKAQQSARRLRLVHSKCLVAMGRSVA
ncbi:hypothetical protein QIS74_08492 [Colletotrichum tabaci]|uniref:Uncharacterized protein n=1 Tax=Colletotrichum tabaci TaxID=1209068 RepID=A0AAV9T864_9PEZI